jgi:predicted phosphoribosyltransferase
MAGRLIEDPLLRDRSFVFRDRADAGKRLASFLKDSVRGGELLLAVPSGGVPVAYEISRALSLDLDLLVVRKLRIPGNPEAGFGAADPDGETVLNEGLLRRLGLGDGVIREQAERAMSAIRRRERVFRKNRPFPDLTGRTVIIVDDGLASGYTMRAAVGFARRRNVAGAVVAVPTGAERTVKAMLREAGLLFCLNVRSGLAFAVAEAYENWHDLTDGEVMRILGYME